MSTLGLLIRPALFTAGFCGTCFCGAAIVQYERRKPTLISGHIFSNWNYSAPKYPDFRNKINTWVRQLPTSEKIAGTTIFVNFLVFAAWRSKSLKPVMTRYFLSKPTKPKIHLSPMILSCFSHISLLHFGLNMAALYSFSSFANSLLGSEQLVSLYLSAGVASSLVSMTHKLVSKTAFPSLGASGAVLGVVAYTCVVRPESGMLVFFIPLAAGTALKAIMVFDCVGLIAKWRTIDHAAHLGGCLYGIWYATYGQKMFQDNRRLIVEKWLQIKRKFV